MNFGAGLFMILDLIILILLAASTFIAFMRGFIREALTLVTLGLSLLAGYWGGPMLRPFMDGWLGVQAGEEAGRLLGLVPMDIVSLVLSYAAIVVLLIIIFSLLSHFIAEFIRSMGLGAIDRSLGALFGLVRGIVLLAILYMPLHFLFSQDQKDRWFARSHGYAYLEQSADYLAGLLPKTMIKSRENADEDTPSSEAKGVDMMDATRETLEKLDVLQKSVDKFATDDTVGASSGGEGEGYSDTFRRELDSLIEQSTQP